MQARKRSEVVCSVVLMAWGAALARALHGTAVGKPLVCGCPSCAKNGDEGVAVAAHAGEMMLKGGGGMPHNWMLIWMPNNNREFCDKE